MRENFKKKSKEKDRKIKTTLSRKVCDYQFISLQESIRLLVNNFYICSHSNTSSFQLIAAWQEVYDLMSDSLLPYEYDSAIQRYKPIAAML